MFRGLHKFFATLQTTHPNGTPAQAGEGTLEGDRPSDSNLTSNCTGLKFEGRWLKVEGDRCLNIFEGLRLIRPAGNTARKLRAPNRPITGLWIWF